MLEVRPEGFSLPHKREKIGKNYHSTCFQRHRNESKACSSWERVIKNQLNLAENNELYWVCLTESLL